MKSAVSDKAVSTVVKRNDYLWTTSSQEGEKSIFNSKIQKQIRLFCYKAIEKYLSSQIQSDNVIFYNNELEWNLSISFPINIMCIDDVVGANSWCFEYLLLIMLRGAYGMIWIISELLMSYEIRRNNMKEVRKKVSKMLYDQNAEIRMRQITSKYVK